jgi:two-component system LytT family response regulator
MTEVDPGASIRAIVVDDESPARQLVAELLAGHPDVDLVASCSNGFEAVQAVREHDPDLLFLDIQMPKLSGFDVLELLDREPTVIFATAFDEHALRAFEVHAVDYLLKPFSAERFAEALAEARKRIAAPTTRRSLSSLAAEARLRPLDRLLVRDGERVHVVPVERVDYLEAQGDATVIRVGERKLRKPEPLGTIAEQLDPRRFFRIHRSYVLNLDRLRGLELYAKDSRVALLADGTRLPVSRAGYQRLRELL